MANDNYAFGMDWYEDNTIKSWDALAAWDKNIQFAYFRLGIGYEADNLSLLNECFDKTQWALGGYFEIGLPSIPKDTQLKVLLSQLEKTKGMLDLPVSLAFEPMGKTTTIPRVWLWPSVGDLKYIASALLDRGYKVNVYTNQSGLDRIKASGIIDLKATDWWIAASYLLTPWLEYPVDSTLAFLQSRYGIQPEHVQFMQTVLDHGNSPIGSGQDFDRAVSWTFDEPEPPEPPAVEEIKSITVHARTDGKAELVWVKYNGDKDITNVACLETEPYPVEPPPPPPPPTTNIYRIKTDVEYMGYSRTSTQEWKDKGGRPMTPATVKLHGDDPVTKFPEAAVKVVHLLNDPRNAFTYVTRESAGWSNRGQTWPEKMEPIVFEGNKLEITRIENNRAYIRTWKGETDDDCVIHRWWNIDQDGVLHDAQNNVTEGPGYIVLAYPGEYWIELDRLVKV